MTDLRHYGIPDDVETTGWTLSVTGTVDRPLDLTRRNLGSFPLETFSGDFVCEEGWVAEDLTWRGVRVGTILDRAHPRDASEYGLVRAMDGGYA